MCYNCRTVKNDLAYQEGGNPAQHAVASPQDLRMETATGRSSSPEALLPLCLVLSTDSGLPVPTLPVLKNIALAPSRELIGVGTGR